MTRHELKYTRKTETFWCTCRQWQMKVKHIPWSDEPSPELIKQTDEIHEQFDKHKGECDVIQTV